MEIKDHFQHLDMILQSSQVMSTIFRPVIVSNTFHSLNFFDIIINSKIEKVSEVHF